MTSSQFLNLRLELGIMIHRGQLPTTSSKTSAVTRVKKHTADDRQKANFSSTSNFSENQGGHLHNQCISPYLSSEGLPADSFLNKQYVQSSEVSNAWTVNSARLTIMCNSKGQEVHLRSNGGGGGGEGREGRIIEYYLFHLKYMQIS